MSRRQRRHGRDVGATLLTLAAHPASAPDPAFADGLEARLRTVHAVLRSGESAAPAQAVGPGRAPAVGWLGWLAPAALAGAGIAGAFVLSGTTAPHQTGPTVQVAQAIDAQLITPNGTATPLHRGTHLAEGTVIRTGTTGQVRADGKALGPDTEAVVHRGHLTVLTRPGRRPVSPPTTTPPPVKPAHPAPPSRGGSKGGQEAPTPPSEPSGRKPAPPENSGSGHATTPPASSIHLTVQQRPHGAQQLNWTPYSGPNLYGYVVLRSRPPADPVYPHDVIHFVPAGAPPSYVDTPGRAARHQVDAIDSSGDILAASAVQP